VRDGKYIQHEVNATPTPGIILPSAPTNLTASVASGSQIDLSWTDASNNEMDLKLKEK